MSARDHVIVCFESTWPFAIPPLSTLKEKIRKRCFSFAPFRILFILSDQILSLDIIYSGCFAWQCEKRKTPATLWGYNVQQTHSFNVLLWAGAIFDVAPAPLHKNVFFLIACCHSLIELISYPASFQPCIFCSVFTNMSPVPRPVLSRPYCCPRAVLGLHVLLRCSPYLFTALWPNRPALPSSFYVSALRRSQLRLCGNKVS